jgi:stress-induced morphogen
MTLPPSRHQPSPALQGDMSNAQWIAERLKQVFPEADVHIQDPRSDDQHLIVRMRTKRFKGMARVQIHQMIYAALENLRQGRLHALSIQAGSDIPEDSAP